MWVTAKFFFLIFFEIMINSLTKECDFEIANLSRKKYMHRIQF